MTTEDPSWLIRAAADRLAAAAARQRAALAKTLGLQRADLLALYYLGRRDDTTPSELATQLMLSSGGTTAVINRLQAAGLLVRDPGPSGHRRVLLRLTAHGRSATATPHAPLVSDITALASGLSPTERACIERFLARLATITDRHADRSAREAEHATAPTGPSTVLWG